MRSRRRDLRPHPAPTGTPPPLHAATAVPLGIPFYLVWVPPSGISQDALVVWLVFWLLVQRLLSTFYAGQS